MPTFGFSAFLKILSMNPRPQRREVRVRLSPSDGGYDFHRSLRLKSHRLMIDREDLALLLEEAEDLGNPAERRSLAAGLQQLDAWRTTVAGEVISLPSALYRSPDGRFSVKFIPDFGYRMSGSEIAIHIWNTGTVQLSPRETYAALAMVYGAYEPEARPDDVAVLSLPDNQLYRLSDVPDQSRLAASVARNLDALFVAVREELIDSDAPPEIRPTPATF